MNTLILILSFVSYLLPVKDKYAVKRYEADYIESKSLKDKNFLPENIYGSSFQINIYEKDGRYELFHLCNLAVDYIFSRCISYGSFTESGDSLVLEDDIYGYKMYMRRNGNRLVFTKSFSVLENRTFIHEVWNDCELISSDWPHYSIDGVKKINAEKYEAATNLLCGVYYGQLTDVDFYLELDSSGNYGYYVHNVPLSTGKWEKKGSELLLKDSSFDAVFSLMITSEGLVSQLIPEDYEGKLILRKINRIIRCGNK